MLITSHGHRAIIAFLLLSLSTATALAGKPPISQALPLWESPASSHAARAIVPLSEQATAAGDPLDASWVGMPLPYLYPLQGVNCAIESGGQLVIGGGFRQAGHTQAKRVALWDGVGFQAMGDPGPGSILSMTVHAGQLYAGTDALPGPPGVKHWNGSTWDVIGQGNGAVNALTGLGTDLIVGGTFTLIEGVTVTKVARFDGAAWHDMPGLPPTATVRDLEVVGGVLYAGGDVMGVRRWDGTTWVTPGVGLNGTVRGLTTDGVDLYAVGSFTKAGPDSVPGVGRWDGSAWHRVGHGTSTLGRHIQWWNGLLFSNQVDGTSGVSVFDGTNWHGIGGPYSRDIFALGVAAGRLVVSGSALPTPSGDVCTVMTYDGANWTPVREAWSTEMTGMTRSLWAATIWNDRLVVGGDHTHLPGAGTMIANRYESAWDGTSWSAVSAAGGKGPQPFALGTWGTSLVVGGLVQLPGINLASVTSFDGVNWQSFAPNMFPYVWGVAEHLGELHVVGDFTEANSGAPPALNHVSRWDGADWQPLGTGLDPSGTGYSIESWNNSLYVGGQFATAGTIAAANIARWDGSAWSALDAGVDGFCYALTSWNGALVAGGDFTHAGGVPAPGAASWDGAAWHPMGSNAVEIVDFAQLAGVLYGVGTFLAPGGAMLNTVARWTGTDWQLLGSGVAPTDGSLAWVEAYHGDLYAGGSFGFAFGKASYGIVRLSAAATVGIEDGPVIPAMALAASPNPGRDHTDLSFALPTSGHVRLSVHDVSGREIARVADAEFAAGSHRVSWNAAGVAPGLYFARLTSATGVRTTRLVLLGR